MENEENSDVRLVVAIKNKQPVELFDLTGALAALAHQFGAYAQRAHGGRSAREAKLYVREVQSGSVIIELVELAAIGVIPFLGSANTIIEFLKYCKDIFDWFLGKRDNAQKPEMTISDYRDFSTMVNSAAKDRGAQIDFSGVINGSVNLSFNVDSTQANAVQNLCKKAIEERSKAAGQEEYERVVLTFFQARSDAGSGGNKGKIESIYDKPLNVIFNSDTIKEAMLYGSDNPFTRAFVVDVRVENINGRISIYRIMKLHEHFELEE